MILDKKYDHHSAPLFDELEWLPFNTRCKFHIGLLVFKALNNLLPRYMQDILILNNTSYNLKLRSASCISHPLIKSRFTRNTFQFSAVQVWNNIPPDIKNAGKLNTFRIKYRKYLLGVQNQ